MTLEEIQNHVAVEYGFKNVVNLTSHKKSISNAVLRSYINEVCRRAQLESGRLTLEKAAENAMTNFNNLTISKESITDPSNIVILK